MTVTIAPAGSWGVATSTSPATEMAALLGLPGSWPWYPNATTAMVRQDQWANATTPAGPPVAGYAAWWDASQIAGSADNTSLTTWADLSGNSHTLTFGSGTAPIYYSSTAGKTVNGKPAVWFTAGGMGLSGWTLAQPFTVVAVARSTAGSGVAQAIFGSAAGNLVMWANTTWQLYAGGSLDTAVTANTVLHSFAAVFNGANSAMDIDGTAHTGSPGAEGVTGSTNVGVASGTTYQWQGPICEVIVYPSALSPANRASLVTYFHNKWGTP